MAGAGHSLLCFRSDKMSMGKLLMATLQASDVEPFTCKSSFVRCFHGCLCFGGGTLHSFLVDPSRVAQHVDNSVSEE